MARMYPSSSSIHPFLHIPQSLHLSPQFLPHIETNNNFISHYQQDMLANHVLSSDFPSGFENLSKAIGTNQQTNDTALNEEVIRNLGNFVIPKKRSGRTDRHSKIYTAGGLRDRRVRLSIEIARKFFKLQDMLGFDKASKTIGWLLNNSKSSITELELKHGRNGGAKNLSSFSGLCDQVEVGRKVKESTCVMGKDKKVNKQSRTRARARARERTREKMIIMCTKEIDDTTEVNDLSPPISNRCTSLMSEKLINGSILYSRFENCDLMKMLLKPSPISNDQLNFPKDFIIPNVHKEYSVISKYWEACNNDGRC